ILPPTAILYGMSNKPSSTRAPRRVHLHAYEHLSRLCAEIQQGRYPTKKALARVVERSPRAVQDYLRALINDFDAPLEFDRVKNGWYFTDPAWRLPAIALTQGELISFFAAERIRSMGMVLLRWMVCFIGVEKSRRNWYSPAEFIRRASWNSKSRLLKLVYSLSLEPSL